MACWLKQSTAAVVSFGPFVDKTDGVTPEVGLVSALDHASTGIKLSKNGGALTIRNATVTATTYDDYGNYRVTIDTTDTGTLGRLRMQFVETATCLPVWQEFIVIPAAVFDSLVSGTGNGPRVDVIAISGDATAADNAEAFFDGTGYTDAVNKISDGVLSRNASNTETTAGEHTLTTVILAMLEHSISGSTLTIKRTDGSTTHATKTLTLNAAADPITGIT